ncbi:squalene--hopene cyclase [Planctomycetales bacterium]|nr:squalene--hopene cyclase [Planctomycetales bacterium]
MSGIFIDPYRKPVQKTSERYKPKNVFSDETNLYLLRLIKGREIALAENQDTQFELAKAVRSRLLPWFWSFLLHSVIFIILACIFLPKLQQFEKIDVLSGIAVIPALQKEVRMNGEAVKEPGTPQTLPAVTPAVTLPGNKKSSSSVFSTQFGNAQFGGGEPDPVILAGLNWLAKVQKPNGSWAFASTGFSQHAPKRREDINAATAMALLAFQGGDIKRFEKTLQAGWQYLRQQQNSADGCFFPADASRDIQTHRFYTQSLCTAALCEYYFLTKEETLRQPAQAALNYLIHFQSLDGGGWRYAADRFSPQSDIAVTGWVVLALKAGESAGLDVPQNTFENTMRFLDRMERNHRYQYREEETDLRVSMTAEALCCRILLGWKPSNAGLQNGVLYLMEALPTFEKDYRRDVYYWFFAANVLYQCGGDSWNIWNKAMRDALVKHQEKEGHEAGSWNPRLPVRDVWGIQYGRLYTTCLSLYILEVPMRYRRIFIEP